MALDYLPVQATSVPCERAFSSSGETDTARRSRIKPELMEALQILKYLLKRDRLTFTQHLQDIEPLQDVMLAQQREGIDDDDEPILDNALDIHLG